MLFTCPRTGKQVSISAEIMGRSFECPSCGQMHLAPVPEARGRDEEGVPAPEEATVSATPPPEMDAAAVATGPEAPDAGAQPFPTEGPADTPPAVPEPQASDQVPSLARPDAPPRPGPADLSGEITSVPAGPGASAPDVGPADGAAGPGASAPDVGPADGAAGPGASAPDVGPADVAAGPGASAPDVGPADGAAGPGASAPDVGPADGAAGPGASAPDVGPADVAAGPFAPPPSLEADAEPPRVPMPVPGADAEAPFSHLAASPETGAAVADEGAASDEEDEDSVPTPAAGFASYAPPTPPPPGRGGRVVALLVVLAAVGAGAYFAWRYVVMMQTRAALASAMSDPRDAHEAGRFAEAVDLAARAEAILADKTWVFTPDELTRYRGKLARHRRALEVFTAAEDAAARAPDDLDAALAELDRLASEPPASEDPVVADAIGRLRAQCVLDEAALIASVVDGKTSEIADPFLRINGLRSLVSAGDATRFDGIVSGLVEREKARALEDAFAGAKEAVGLFKDGKIDAAFERAEKVECDLASSPSEVADPAFEEFLAEAAKLATSDAEAAARFGISDDDLPAAAQLFGIRAVLREAGDVCETGASDFSGSASKLNDLRTKALEGKGPNADAPGLAAKEVEALAGELAGLGGSYRGWHARSSADARAFLSASVARFAMSSPRVRFRPKWIEEDAGGFRAEFRIDGMPASLEAGPGDYGTSVRIRVASYAFRAPWEFFMYRRLLFAAALAPRMRAAGVDPGFVDEWEMVEGPGSPLARGEKDGRTICFVEGDLAEAREEAGADRRSIEEFTEAARELRESVKADESIESELRLCFDATLAATFGETDPRDWLEPAFCRRIVAEGYLERSVPGLAKEHRDILERYRAAYARLAAGYPVFSLKLTDGRTLTAFGSLEGEISGAGPRPGGRATYSWRIDSPGGAARTTFVAPLPERNIHPLYVAATFEGSHESQPDVRLPGADAGEEAVRLSMEHVIAGTLASKRRGASAPDVGPADAAAGPGAWELDFDQGEWDRVLGDDSGLFRNETYGTPGWAFPPHVPVLDANGTARAILTRRGLLASRDFAGIAGADARREAGEEYLDECAEKLPTPGELGFLFKYFTKYVYDSPVASQPDLLGNHLAMGDTHQTAAQFLERKLGGYFLGDCDDVAEFFQMITRRQDRLSHVFSLPKHAVCGFVEDREPPPGKEYELVFLQTGPPRTFKGATLDEVVEEGVMAFSENEDQSFTVAAVAFLFRFANEQTRTPYVLSDRIIVDEDYADIMIRVQSYWHYHYYATAFRTMEALLEKDKDISNFTELAGLYRYVGLYEKSIEMSRAGLAAMKRSDEKIRQRELLDIATMHQMAGDDLEARKVLLEIMERTLALRDRGVQEYARLMSVRFRAAGLYASLEEPVAGFRLVEEDLRISRRYIGKIPDPLRRTLVALYVSLREKEERGEELTAEQREIREELSRTLLRDFAKDLFEDDDGFNAFLRHYSLIGSFASAAAGRERATELLLADGPYPDGTRNHLARKPGLTPEDWEWFRICPPLYMGLAREAADPLDAPHRWTPPPRFHMRREHDPALAVRLIDAMLKGADAGRKLGSMNAMEGTLLRGRMLRAILRSDLKDFEAVLAEVKSKDWSRHFEAASSAFGDLMGLLRLEDVPAWMDVFRRYVPGKQHYFRIAYWALDEGYFDHGLAAAERAVTYFPDEAAMAGELVYMRDLVKRLKALAAERAVRQGRDVPARDLTTPEPVFEPAAIPAR